MYPFQSSTSRLVGISRASAVLLLLLITLIFFATAKAGEGFWTFDEPPIAQIARDHAFRLEKDLLDHIQFATAVLDKRCAASFISSRGLLLTNYHVGLAQIARVSTPARNLLETGFCAQNDDSEVPCPGLAVRVLLSIEDVTGRVCGAVRHNASLEEAAHQRRAEIARIESERVDHTGRFCEVISFSEGDQYKLYQYAQYDDVRLVFAPEHRVTQFGGAFDNFVYPRFNFDVALFRVYRDGAPIVPRAFLRVSTRTVVEGALVFVSGLPGSEQREKSSDQLELLTVSNQRFLRETEKYLEGLRSYASRRSACMLSCAPEIRHVQNAIKRVQTELRLMETSRIIADKKEEERQLLEAAGSQPGLREELARALEELASEENPSTSESPEPAVVCSSSAFSLALHLALVAQESEKPNEKRLAAYRQPRLSLVKQELLAWPSLDKDSEQFLLTRDLQQILMPNSTSEAEAVATIVGSVVAGTKLYDLPTQRKLIAGGSEVVASSDDPLLRLARDEAKKMADILAYLDQLPTGANDPLNKIAKARTRLFGAPRYPPANSTLRLSYGVVKGYSSNETLCPYKTTFAGLYDRHYSFDGAEPFDLPLRFLEGKDRLDLSAPLNFVCTCDFAPGNSGSAVISTRGELVGMLFDGNIESIELAFRYTDQKARAIALSAGAIPMVLRQLYGLSELADEIERQ